MLAALTIALLAAFLAYALLTAWVSDRKDQRVYDELGRLRDERQGLIQRIQAPEMAVMEHAQRHAPEQDPNPYPLSEAETAAGQGVTQALIAQIQRMEDEGVDMHMPRG
jgi:hypothetical protein